MSLDLVVWLSCSIALPQDLPRDAEWSYHKSSSAGLPNIPKELAALIDGQESWQVNRDKYLIRASYTVESVELQSPRDLPAVRSPAVEEISRFAKRQADLAERASRSKVSVSLVLEGDYDAGYPEQSAIATHLAQKCKGGVVEGPTGLFQVDNLGEWSQ